MRPRPKGNPFALLDIDPDDADAADDEALPTPPPAVTDGWDAEASNIVVDHGGRQSLNGTRPHELLRAAGGGATPHRQVTTPSKPAP